MEGLLASRFIPVDVQYGRRFIRIMISKWDMGV